MTLRRSWPLPLALASAVWLAVACESDVVEDVVEHRENCLVCHQPRASNGKPHGIEDAHPGFPLSCVDCHGGNPWVCNGTLSGDPDNPNCDGAWIYDKKQAHVSPGSGAKYLKNLSTTELDQHDPAYVRFINPGDFRVLDQTCGKCHVEESKLVPRSTMAHTSGEVTVARWRAGAQPDPYGLFGGQDIKDDTYDPANKCSVAELKKFDPPAMVVGSTDPKTAVSVANAQDQYMVKSCMRCHLNDFGENRFRGDFRSSGCTACHMPYADDGLSQSDDPRISKQTVPHPIKHELTNAIPLQQCTRCHYRGGRLGIGYQGYRESAGAGENPERPIVLGQALHGHDANYYIVDEDFSNDFDETPADVHFEAGMHCIDCHTLTDVHGDGHLYADTQCSVRTECTDCHGTVRERAKPEAGRNNLYERDGKLWLKTKVTNLELEVTQVKDVITPGHPPYTEFGARSMGINAQGFSHTDELECYTCHAGWSPSCYGCHVELDLSKEKRYQTTGQLTPGHPTGKRRWVQLNDLVLMRNSDGLLAPSMPAERFFMTVTDADASAPSGKKTLIENSPRTFKFPGGRTIAGFGQRGFNPHTTRRRSQFMACDRCHSVGDATKPKNKVLLDITHGFGSQRYNFEACDVTNLDPSCDPKTDVKIYALDAIINAAGEPLVATGHPDPKESRPLTLAEIMRMRAVVVKADEPIKTPIPSDALIDTKFPRAQKVE